MTTTTPHRDRIVARVRKLMAFDHGTATEAEVRNAMELAGRLMEAHAIELDEVASAADAAGGAEDTAIERDLRASPPAASIAYWEQVLVSAVLAAVPGVGSYVERRRIAGTRRGSSRIVWYGPADAVEVAELLFEETRLVIGTLAAGMYGGCYRGPGRSYAEGFAETLLLAARDVRTSSANASRMTALVPRIEAGNQQWLADRHGVRTRVKRVAPPSGEHFDDAFEHGEQDGREHEFGTSRERLDSTASR